MTTPEEEIWEASRWEAARRLFHEALALPKPQRDDFLNRECEGNEALRRMVTRLLAADEQSADFLESPLPPLLPRALKEGQVVGSFRIAERIGAGNMGEVYRAERDDDFRMSVALKVIDATKVSEEMIWRFKHERQILASLDHPNIARIIDGGTLNDGRPWFALQYIEGERIDRYCDRCRLTVRERIVLFRKVCAAVGEAHGLAIVHRDLKPANILVGSDAEPKLLDFGIAKIAEKEPLAGGVVPRSGAEPFGSPGDSPLDSNPLTPLYASPEQAAPILDPEGEEHPPVGVRSDVYSLGVVLYQLLTGHLPYREGHLMLVLRSVLEDTPPPPSQVVATVHKRRGRIPKLLTLESVAAERHTRPAKLRRQLSGDLDAILCRALEKRPENRYASVAELDADLCAYLEGYPVMPRKTSNLYRAGRFLRRNLLSVVATAALLSIVSIYFVMDWRAERQLFDTRVFLHELTRTRVEEISDEEFARALQTAVTDYGDEVWLADHLEGLGLDLEARGRLRSARILFEENLAMRLRLLGPHHPDLAASYNNLAGALMRLGEYEAAERSYVEDLEIRREHFADDPVKMSRSWNNLAALYQHWGGEHLAKARPWLEKALEAREEEVRRLEELGEDTARAKGQLLATHNNLATQYLLEHRFDEAAPLYRTVLDRLETFADSGGIRQKRAGVLRNLALAQLGQGEAEAAEASAREAVRIFRRDFLHWRIADAESVLGACLASQDRPDEARYLLEQSIEDLRASQKAWSRHAREAEERNLRWLGG